MVDGDKTYETIVLPRALTAPILKMAHDNLRHNGPTEPICCLRGYITGKV